MTRDSNATEALRHDQAALLAELEAAGAGIKNAKSIRCFCHDDRHASAGTYQDEGGVWRFKCHGGDCGFCGDIYDVRARATGKTVADVLRETHAMQQTKTASKPAAPKTVKITTVA